MTDSSDTPARFISATASEIAARVGSGEWTASEVLAAHIQRIERVDPKINAVVVRLFDQARAQAAEIDASRGRGEELGPLAGVPITIKECFHVAGTPTTVGLRHLAAKLRPADAPLVARLRRAGAVILGKTNVPQMMLMHETANSLYGRTNNPWNLARSPGGSSGGEAAIIAAGGSALGLANDLGGSIRQPAHACGIYGFKPTSGRVSNRGILSNFRGMEAIAGQPGPMARSVADLTLAMRVLSGAGDDLDDPLLAPTTWPEPLRVSLAGLRVAMWTDDGFFHPAPSVRRAVAEAAAALGKQGVHVEEFAPPDVADAMRIYFHLLSADGGRDAVRLLGADAPEPDTRKLLLLGRLPTSIRPALGWLFEHMGQRRLARLICSTGPVTAGDYWKLVHERRTYVTRFFAALKRGGFDAMLCPPHALPALTHGSFGYLPAAGSYSMLMNLLGVPAGTVPITKVRSDEISDRVASRDWVERAALAVEADSAGLPIGVQIAAWPWRDDIALALMAALETHFSSLPDYPRTPRSP